LSVEDQVDYVQSLWDRIAAGVDQMPLHQWQAELLEERLQRHREDPDAAQPASEVIERLRQSLR
jgi:putative addiction module component (TIGR02574 family)